jgi:hypothetical protein
LSLSSGIVNSSKSPSDIRQGGCKRSPKNVYTSAKTKSCLVIRKTMLRDNFGANSQLPRHRAPQSYLFSCPPNRGRSEFPDAGQAWAEQSEDSDLDFRTDAAKLSWHFSRGSIIITPVWYLVPKPVSSREFREQSPALFIWRNTPARRN